MLCRIKPVWKIVRFWPCYFLAFLVIAGIKYRYSSVDVELLGWILAPTAWWAGILTGEGFPWQAGVGYVSVPYQFVIANTCSGIQFMMIVIAALVFGFVHQMGTLRKAMAWTIGSIAGSYLFTVFVNGVRIACAIFLPRRLHLLPGVPAILSSGWLTPDRLHTVIGIVVYFASLLFIYEMAGAVLGRRGIVGGGGKAGMAGASGTRESGNKQSEKPKPGTTKNSSLLVPDESEKPGNSGIWVPVFWYFFIVLGIPFLNRAYERRPEAFTEYAVLLGIVCTGVLAVYWVLKRGRRRSRDSSRNI